MKQRLAVILSQFPRYDEAFILRDLQAIAQSHPDMAIFSLRPCRDKVIHAQAKALQPQTVYAPFFFSLALWRSHVWFLSSAPQTYWSLLAWIFSRHWRHPIVLLKTLALFPKTVHFARLAQQQGITWLHAGWATYPASSAWMIARLLGIPYSVAGHAHDLYTANPALMEKLRAARFVVTCTEANKEYLDGLDVRANGRGHAKANVIVSYHGVDLSKFAAATKAPSSACEVLCVGSLLPCKGLETLIEACRQLKESGFDARCTLAGGGPLEKALRKQIREAHLEDRVTITGFVSQEQVIGFYQRAHLFILPLVSKIHWGIPNVLIEALATKTPVVSCDLPSMRELIRHGESGWIVPEQDPAAVAAAVRTLWADPALRARMAENGYQRVVERFSLERTGTKLRALFEGAYSG